MEAEEIYAAEGWQLFGLGMTASGLASAAQLTDVTPLAVINVGEFTAPTTLILVKGPTDKETPLVRNPYLSTEDSQAD